MLLQIVHHKAAAGDDLRSIGANQLQRALHQFRRDATAAQRARGFGVGDDDRARCESIIRKRNRVLDVEFESAPGLVVADAASRHTLNLLKNDSGQSFRRVNPAMQTGDQTKMAPGGIGNMRISACLAGAAP